MSCIGVFIGGSPLPDVGEATGVSVDTPWGEASEQPRSIEMGSTQYVLMRRHGTLHQTNPHQINYRANVWLMREMGVTDIVGTHTVGSIDPALAVGELVLPTQLIDYTWGRTHTYDDQRRHIEFSEPYTGELRDRVLAAGVPIHDGGVYGCTQGPRLETKAEIVRMGRDGCTLVGMTGMPEASLARELNIGYASVCVVVNPAAGVGAPTIDMAALRAASEQGAKQIWTLLGGLASLS